MQTSDAMTRTYGPEYEEPDTLFCQGCGGDVPNGESVSLNRETLCQGCGAMQAAHIIADWADAAWSPPPGALRTYQQAREVLTAVLARTDARAKAEGEKPMFGRVG